MTQRLTFRSLPYAPTPCPKGTCVYNESGICSSPQVNKGNSDASCFDMSNKGLLALLLVSTLKRS